MISVPMKSSGAVNSQTVMAINQQNIQGPKTSQNVKSLNYMKSNQSSGVTAPSPNNTSISNHTISNSTQTSSMPQTKPISIKTIPALINPVQKGQKIAIENQGKLFDLAVNQYNSNTAEDASINGKPALIDLKNGEKVILVLLPLKKHIVCSGTENTHGNLPKHEII